MKETEKETDMIEKAREVAKKAGVKMRKIKDQIWFYFPSGRKCCVWFPKGGRIRDLHLQDLEEVITSLERGLGAN